MVTICVTVGIENGAARSAANVRVAGDGAVALPAHATNASPNAVSAAILVMVFDSRTRAVQRPRQFPYTPRRMTVRVAVAFLLLVWPFRLNAADIGTPPPGTLVDVGGHKVHVYCTGNAGPTIV